MKYEVIPTSKFKKDLAKMIRQRKDTSKLDRVVDMLADGKTLPTLNKDHKLTGSYKGYRECHVEPDWLLVYKIEKSKLVLSLTRTGSHSELLDM